MTSLKNNMCELSKEAQNIKLTRYLYIYDEVKYSLLISLTMKTGFDEVLFWISEIYESGFYDDLWQFMYSIYYNFYALAYPLMEKYLIKQHNKWLKTNDESLIIKCFKNMYHKACDTKVFYIYLLSNDYSQKSKSDRNFVILKGRGSKLCCSFDKKHRQFVKSLEKKHNENIGYYMSIYNEDEFVDIIGKYIQLHNPKYVFEVNDNYGNKKHVALYNYLCNEYGLKDSKNKKQLYVAQSSSEMDLFESTQEYITPVYKTLAHHMKYPIREEVGQFKLVRDDIPYDKLKSLYWYHWEILCYHTPCWRERFDDFGITLELNGDNCFGLKYPNDDVYEEFWENYNLEFDEQSKEVQMKALKELKFVKSDIERLPNKFIY